MSLFGQLPLKMRFMKFKSRFVDVSLEVQNIVHLFRAAIWSDEKVVYKNKMAMHGWISLVRVRTCLVEPVLDAIVVRVRDRDSPVITERVHQLEGWVFSSTCNAARR